MGGRRPTPVPVEGTELAVTGPFCGGIDWFAGIHEWTTIDHPGGSWGFVGEVWGPTKERCEQQVRRIVQRLA